MQCSISTNLGASLDKNEKTLYVVMAFLIAALAICGVWIEGPTNAFKQAIVLQTQNAQLINDFTVYATGGSFINVAAVGALALILVYFASINLSGPTVATILTMMGFSFFGTTLLNSIPIIFGVYLASRYANQSFGSYSIIALFGTAIGPVVTFLIFTSNIKLLYSIPIGIVAGILIGFILPSLASSMLQLHQGYNLYNMGFTSGFVGLFIAGILKATDIIHIPEANWGTNSNIALSLVVPFFSLAFIVAAFLTNKPKDSFKGFREIQKMIGRLPSDFFDTSYFGGTLLNIGLLGLLYYFYVLAIKAPINGPVVGGLLTIMAFGGFGKTLKNTIPIVLGVILATLLFNKGLTTPGPLLAVLFCTTLAPIAGQFGPIIGILAGMLHLVMVEVTGLWHGALNLYNNGFAGGLTAILIVAILQWFSTYRERRNNSL